MEPFDDRLRDGEAVEGARAAADLVEDHEAPRRGAVEDPRRLCHLDEEGAGAGGEVVAGADPGEEPVDDPDPGAAGRDETPRLRHHRPAAAGRSHWRFHPR